MDETNRMATENKQSLPYGSSKETWLVGAGDATGSHDGLRRLLEKVHRERGFDFREYREAMVKRRLGRRMRARGIDSYANYARILD